MKLDMLEDVATDDLASIEGGTPLHWLIAVAALDFVVGVVDGASRDPDEN